MTVSVVGFGGLTIGRAGSDQELVTRLLNRALDNGLNLLDTAECYGFPEQNHSESLIGSAVGNRRKEFFICSKVGHENGAFAQQHEDWSAASIHRTIDRSLRRLKTDVLDLVYLHGTPWRVMRDADCIPALQHAHEAGKIRYLGYSGSGDRLRYAINSGMFQVIQLSLNIFDQEAIDKILPLAQEKGLGVITKRPMGNAVWRYEERPDWWYYHEYWELMHALGYPFLKADALNDSGPEGAGGMALRFVTSTPGVHCAIVGTRNPGRWSQNNANVTAGSLPVESYRAIRKRWQEVMAAAAENEDGTASC